jgi:hypothetical protein
MYKLVIAMKTMSWSGVLSTPKISWYLANHDIQNRVFYILTKYLSKKNTIVFFNIMILSQNFKNTLFPNTHEKDFWEVMHHLSGVWFRNLRERNDSVPDFKNGMTPFHV